jgi:hypothetical protein
MAEADPAALARISEAFDRAHEEAAAIVATLPDSDTAFKTAEEGERETQGKHNDRWTRLKAREAVRIRKDHDLSLVKLAERTNRSKSGVALFVKIAEEEPCPSSPT